MFFSRKFFPLQQVGVSVSNTAERRPPIRGFHKLDEIANNANIGIREFTMWKQKIPVKNVTPSGNRTWAPLNPWFQVQHSPFWTKLKFACKTETLYPLYSHALLILTKSSKSGKSSGAWTEV